MSSAPILTRRAFVASAAASAFVLATAMRKGALAALGDDAYATMTARDAIEALRAGRTSVLDYVESLMARADRLASLNAFITQDKDVVRAAARALDARIAAGEELSPLWGLPFCVKDNTNTAGMPTTGGTPAFKGWVPPANAPVVQSLLDAGGVLIGKTNMHELAFGITSNNAAFGPVRNPYDQAMIPGGSSGGTAAAVAAGLAPVGLGSDTGGSCRIPAALCGCVGFRPSLGRWPQNGIIPISSTRDTSGPLGRTVDDAVLLDSICASDAPMPLELSLADMPIGVPRQYFYDNLDPQLATVVARALDALSNAGAKLVEVNLDGIADLNAAVSFPVALYEVLREMAAYLYKNGSTRSVQEVVAQVAGKAEHGILASQMGPDAIPAAAYREALVVARPRLIAAYQAYFADNGLAAMVVPTTPLPARPIGQEETVELNGEQVPTFLTYIQNTDPPSNAGVPCLSVPAGLTADGLPVGVEFVGPPGADATVLGIGRAFEAARGPAPGPDL
jgi:Asp-tRNA(Asn)/Glu-tRNA(Gln) amidotransferase A subunit family amidase